MPGTEPFEFKDLLIVPALRTFYLLLWDMNGRPVSTCTLREYFYEAAEETISLTFGITLPLNEESFAAYGRFAIFDESWDRVFPSPATCPIPALDLKSIKPAP